MFFPLRNVILFMGERRVGRKSGWLLAFLYFSEEIFWIFKFTWSNNSMSLILSIDKCLVLVDKADMKPCSTCSLDPF
jgi:hypothetical protein